MANKRKPLTFPELDELEPKPKGRRAILRTSEEVEAEEQILERESQQTGIPENQKTSIPENKYSSNTETQQASKLENQDTSIPADVPESQDAGNRNRYPKVTYRLSPDAIDAIDEAKRILRRQYKLKASLVEIAEEAIIAACNDLLDNQNASNLVNKFSGKLENKKTSK
jgi:hypothetical protein